MFTRLNAVLTVGTALLCATGAHAQSSQVPPPWKAADVGVVGIPGSVVANANNTWKVSGAGSDIWGTADSFFFVYQPIRDGVISADVESETNTSPFAKTGVMIRQTLDPGSPEVILDVKPDGGIEFMKRSAQGGDTSFIAGASVPASTDASGNAVVPVALALTRDGNTVSATYCVSGSCTPIGSTDFPAGQALVGIAVTSHNPGALNNAVFNPPPFAATGTGVDIGEVGTPGYATFENATGTYFVSGAGSDIWGTADSFHAVLRDIVGDSVLSARVVSEDATNPFAKAGLVIGDSTASGARVILDVKPDGGIEFMARSTNGASMSFIAGSNGAFPVWLRLTRTGDQFTAETSSDGSAWTSVGTVTVTMPADTFGGFAVTSHDPSTLNNAVFDELGYTTGRRFGPVGPNLLVNGGFEESIVPNTAPGWVSDTPLRQTPAVTETTLPHTGAQDAACRTTSGDCGIYQDIDASTLTTGNLWFTIYARADHPGALVGVNIDGKLLGVTRVVPGDYQRYDIALTTYQVAPPPYKTIRVWMYAPPAAGVVAIDDVEFVEYFGPR